MHNWPQDRLPQKENDPSESFAHVHATIESSIDCIYTAAQPARQHQCIALACIDNTLDYYDENRGNTLPMARTQLFSIVSMTAMFGSVLGLVALVTNKVIVWKLMCFLFFLWGPASLHVPGPSHA